MKTQKTNETRKTSDYEETEKIRKGLYDVAKTYLENKAGKYDKVTDISKKIQEHESTAKSFFYKIFQPREYIRTKAKIDRLKGLRLLWISLDDLVEKIEVETKENLSPNKIDVLYGSIKNLEDEFKYTPQFEGKSHPDKTLYELQFQFPSFVREESKDLLETPSEEIAGFNTKYVLNDYFSCLFKYAKNHPEIAESVMKKMAEVYRLNKTPERISLSRKASYISPYALIAPPRVYPSPESDLREINQLGKSLGLTEEQVYEKYLSCKKE